jgi:hypothetical protein
VVGGNGTGSAWAAADIAMAQETPLLLLKAPGWNVSRFDQYKSANTDGGMTFRDSAVKDKYSNGAGLAWGPKSHVRSTLRQYASRAVELAPVTVEGQNARVFRQHSSGSGPIFTGHAAVWVSGGQVLTFHRGYRGAPSKLEDARFAKLLAQLKTVSSDAFLTSLPKGYLVPSKLPGAATEILADVPQPAGYSAQPVLTNLKSSTHETLAERLIVGVQCAWVHDWVAARKAGDKTEMKKIAQTVAPYRTWRYAPTLVGPKGKTYFGEGYMESLKHGGRMDFGRGDVRDIGKIYRSYLGCDF